MTNHIQTHVDPPYDAKRPIVDGLAHRPIHISNLIPTSIANSLMSTKHVMTIFKEVNFHEMKLSIGINFIC